MADNTVTLVGNVTKDPELRFTSSGQAVADFGLAINNRKRNDRGEWEDGEPQFFDITVWRQLAENVAESIQKGNRVVVTGRLNYRKYETQAGESRVRVSVIADEVGPSLKWATAQVVRNERRDGDFAGGDSRPAPSAPAAPSGSSGGGGGYDPDEEPF